MKLSSKIGSYIETLSESAGIFTAIGVLLVAFASSNLVFHLMQYLVVNFEYGHVAWVGGLRVSNWKHGVLSNGDFLAGWPSLFFYFGFFILWGLSVFGSLFLFSYIGMRLRGRRLSDPKPKKKKKWQSSGESDSSA